MSDWPYSVVMLVPAAIQAEANRLAAGLGHGPRNFSVGLSASGQEPATHYGCRTQAQQSFVDLLAGMGQGEFPPIEGADPQIIGAILASLIIDISENEDGFSHFNRVIEANGLTRFEVEPIQ
jgi:hypothetical protein